MIHPSAGRGQRKEMVARTDGIPALIVEVASDSTWRHDVNLSDGKAAGYMAMGVPNYLVFDPTRAYLREACRAWRLDDTQRVPGRAVAWQPDRAGRYRCASLEITLLPEDYFLRVIDEAGRLVPTRVERIYESFARLEQNQALRQENTQLAGQNTQLAEENARLRAELGRLLGRQLDDQDA